MQHEFEDIDLSKIKPIQTMAYKDRVNHVRERWYQTYVSRLTEILPYFIGYQNLPPTLSALQIESQLRIGNQDLIIGLDAFNQLVVLGRPTGTTYNFYNYPLVTGIQFTIPREQQLPYQEYVQITPNQPNVGNFVLVRNRYNPVFKSDVEIIEDFAIHLSEIKKIRYSLTLQAGVSTYIKGKNINDNNTINKMLDDIYEGAPFLKMESNLNTDNIFGTLDNSKVIPLVMSAMKDEQENIFNEALNLIGVDNVGVTKQSGISKDEVTANAALSNNINNIYLISRQEPFDLLNNHEKIKKIIGDDPIKPILNNVQAQRLMNMVPTDEEVLANLEETSTDSSGSFGKPKGGR